MKNLLKKFYLLIAMYFVIGHCVVAQIVPFSSDQWSINARSNILEDFQEQPALYLQNGIAYLPNVDFQNGIIEFDILLMERRSFSGVIFRMADQRNYEELYLRSHLSGKPDAMQYTPVNNGNSAWQLYHDQGAPGSVDLNDWQMETIGGYNAPYIFPFGKWLHVKLLIFGTEAEVYFDNEETPTLRINELKRGLTSGAIGVKSGQAPCYFANFSYQKMDRVALKTKAPEKPQPDPNIIKTWMISDAFGEEELQKATELATDFMKAKKWDSLTGEWNGIINISSIRDRDREHNTVLAKVNIDSDRAQMKQLQLGFSDRARVYCNGKVIYAGDNSYQSQDYRHLGTIGFHDAVYLPLQRGTNEIVIAISETFGGWGLQARLEDRNAIQLP